MFRFLNHAFRLPTNSRICFSQKNFYCQFAGKSPEEIQKVVEELKKEKDKYHKDGSLAHLPPELKEVIKEGLEEAIERVRLRPSVSGISFNRTRYQFQDAGKAPEGVKKTAEDLKKVLENYTTGPNARYIALRKLANILTTAGVFLNCLQRKTEKELLRDILKTICKRNNLCD